VNAALTAVSEDGWDATSMERVRALAGISNGSLFHHFPTRLDLQAAVMAAALSEHQGLVDEVLRGSRRPDRAVREVVRLHFAWLERRQHVALLLVTTPRHTLLDRLTDDVLEENRRFMARLSQWLARHGWGGKPSLPLVMTLWIGPANDYARGWLGSGEPPDPGAARVMGDAAWRALAPYLKERS
jgi:AcrR family transcriptional regulator